MKSLNRILDAIEDYAAAVCFAAMCIVILIAVFMRYVLVKSFPVGEELARYLMIWGVFFGISIGVRHKAHLGVDVFVSMLPSKGQAVLSKLSGMIVVASYLFLSVISVLLILKVKSMGQRTPAMQIPTWMIYSALPVGFILSFIRSVQVAWADLRQPAIPTVAAVPVEAK